MQPAGQEVTSGKDRGHPRRLPVPELDGYAIDLAHVQVAPVHELLIQYLPAELNHHPPMSWSGMATSAMIDARRLVTITAALPIQ